MYGKSWIRVLTISSFFLLFFKRAAHAEPCDPYLDPFCTDPVPLDGGVGLLIAASLAYGLKKIKSVDWKQ